MIALDAACQFVFLDIEYSRFGGLGASPFTPCKGVRWREDDGARALERAAAVCDFVLHLYGESPVRQAGASREASWALPGALAGNTYRKRGTCARTKTCGASNNFCSR